MALPSTLPRKNSYRIEIDGLTVRALFRGELIVHRTLDWTHHTEASRDRHVADLERLCIARGYIGRVTFAN